MPGLYLYRSNRLETLAERLTGLIREPLESILQPELIVVQSQGMARWLSLQIAEQLGVAMNCEFPFPAGFAHRLFRAAFQEVPEVSAFSREILPWRVMTALPGLLEHEDAAPLRLYLAGEMGELKRFQLAEQIAAVLDRYSVHRAAKLLEWQRTEPTEWQGRLWRELTRGFERTNPPALLKRLLDRLEIGETSLDFMPERVCVFGASSLSPFYVDLLGAAAHSLEVHLFLLEPTEQYWGDIQSPREQSQFLRRFAKEGQSAEDFHLDAGNPLLASMGKPARAFARSIQALEPIESEDLFAEPTTNTLLHSVRADIFNLRDRRTEESPRDVVEADDCSIQIHCCHGPMREVEVLYDRLLDLFERLPELAPKDILVMMPDVESYTPFIEAVFGVPEHDSLRIPFTIADRSVQSESPVARALLGLLDLYGSRFTAPGVLSLLEHEVVRNRFGLRSEDLETLHDWVERAGIRWGIDAAHRATFGVPETEQNTWRFGLDRLLLGYALPGDGHQLFDGILPIPEIEGERAETLGQFIDFAEKAFTLIPALKTARTISEWAETLRDLLATFLDESDETAREISELRAVFEGMDALTAHHDEPIAFEVLRAYLERAFGDTDSGGGFLAGLTTFCSFKPMRSVPFRVICVLGLNDTAFPRSDTPLAFDLTAAETQPGDRSRRDDDRQVFLETILSARETLYLSYSGFSLQDHSETPPSVVVSELLDFIESNYELEDAEQGLRAHLVTRHRLQAFSPVYFSGDPRLFSYSAENSHASHQRHLSRETPAREFCDADLPATEPAWRHVDLDRLADFLCHPARYFSRERLGLRLPDGLAPLEESEPMVLNALDKTILRGEIIQQTLAGLDGPQTLALSRATGRLPSGWAGDSTHRQVAKDATDLLSRVSSLREETPLPPLHCDLTLGDWRLTGTLGELRPSAALRYRPASINARDILRAWVAHLAMNAIGASGYPTTTIVYGVKQKLVLGPVANARELLADLLDLYGEGLLRPVPLFARTSYAYAETLAKGDATQNTDAALKAALDAWEGSSFSEGVPGEREDPFIQLCFRGKPSPLDPAWRDLARRVFDPLLHARLDDSKSPANA